MADNGCWAKCRSVPLERRAKTAGVVDMIVASITIIVVSVQIHRIRTGSEDGKTLALIVSGVTLLENAVKLIMGFILWKGASERNVRKCLGWLRVSAALWTLEVISYIFDAATGGLEIWEWVLRGLGIVIRFLVMFIVYKFIQEIQRGKNQSTAINV